MGAPAPGFTSEAEVMRHKVASEFPAVSQPMTIAEGRTRMAHGYGAPLISI